MQLSSINHIKHYYSKAENKFVSDVIICNVHGERDYFHLYSLLSY